MNVSLQADLGISKRTLRNAVKNFIECIGHEDERFPEASRALELLRRRGDFYNLEEAEHILDYYLTSHDECVMLNEEDFSAVEVWQANRKEKRLDKALKVISEKKLRKNLEN